MRECLSPELRQPIRLRSWAELALAVELAAQVLRTVVGCWPPLLSPWHGLAARLLERRDYLHAPVRRREYAGLLRAAALLALEVPVGRRP